MILAETIAVEGVAIGGAVLVAVVGAIAGYATTRANVGRNTERIEKLEETVIPGLEAKIEDTREDFREIQRDLDFSAGKERGARGGDSVTKTWEGRRKR